ncbi:MAG: hypothetical protein DRQ55_07000 [Planctomycetota bacterium]|nr:MAG: hypothetical protein DRQ55_07000 [Planctomycetota bacterium]
MSRLMLQALAGSATGVALQVLLPRLFSVVLWYHLAFLAVSLAMLGFALGGSLVRRRVEATGAAGGGLDRDALLAWASLAVLGAVALAVRLPIDASELLERPQDGLLLALLVTGISAPFVLLGTLVCSALDLAGERLPRVYGATFLGGAAGALMSLGAMEWLGTRTTLGVIAVLPALVALSGARRRPLALVALLASLTAIALPDAVVPRASRKHFPRVPAEHILLERSDATSDVIFYENPDHHGLWEVAADPSAEVPETVGVAIDAWAITFITRRDGSDDFTPLLRKHPAGLAYAGAAPGFSALVLGAGGGWDVLGALDAGASQVTAVELDPFIVEAVQGRWASYSGDLYHDPRVTAVVAEGRHYVESHEQRYDRIVLAGVDTFAATQAGAFALAENHLYTLEGVSAYLRRLNPGGRLFLTRWWFEPPRQTLRLLLTLAEALRQDGVADPRRRIYVAQGGNSLTVIKQGADFSEAELDELEQEAISRGAHTVYAWGRPSHATLVQALDAPDPVAWADAYEYRVDPTTDDRPFFFENGRLGTLFRSEGNWIHDRLGGQEVLVATFIMLALLSSLLLSGARNRAAGGFAVSAAFLSLGAAYLLVEVSAMQRLVLVLGHPVYAVAVVLVSLLMWSGCGSLLSARLPARAAPWVCALAAVLVAAVLVPSHGLLLGALAGQPLALRIVAVSLALLPAALVMGMCFPLAVRSLGSGRQSLLPSAFLWNGAASVLTGPLAVMLAMDQGLARTQLAGAACYLAATLALLLATRRTPTSA